VSLVCGSCTEREKASVEAVVWGRRLQDRERERAEAETDGTEYQSRRSLADRLVVAMKRLLAGVGVEPRGRLTRNVGSFNQGRWSWEEAKMNMPKPKDKPFAIPKSMVWEAYRRVAANKGAPGVDGQALDEFEADLRDNLYKVWNRMSSGTWFAAPVRAVEIPKPHGGGVRVLGVPTVISYRCVVQRAFGFVGGHASVPSVVWAAAGGSVCASRGCRSDVCVRWRWRAECESG
jgi:hypothetical protein